MKIAVNQRVKVLNVRDPRQVTSAKINEALGKGLTLFITWGRYIVEMFSTCLDIDVDDERCKSILAKVKPATKFGVFNNTTVDLTDEEYEFLKQHIDHQDNIIKIRFKEMIEKYND